MTPEQSISYGTVLAYGIMSTIILLSLLRALIINMRPISFSPIFQYFFRK